MNASLLVNTLGHSAGVLIFGIFLVLLFRDRSGARLRGSRKSILAAALALVWNLASLIVLGYSDPNRVLPQVTVAIGFSAISLLPAVLFDLCLLDRFRGLVAVGYALSIGAISLHLAELIKTSATFHGMGITLITVGFGLLAVAAAAGLVFSREANRRRVVSRLLGTMSLFLLALSFVHLGATHAEQAWSRELAFHHAAIPLALLVLLQDYRFVLLDAFLRFLANVMLAAVFAVVLVTATRELATPGMRGTEFREALLLVGACLLLILFAVLRSRVQVMLTRLVFRRTELEKLLRAVKTGSSTEDETEYLKSASVSVAEFMHAELIEVTDPAMTGLWRESNPSYPMLVTDLSRLKEDFAQLGAEVIVPLRLGANDVRPLVLGRRHGGHRYLSEDLQALGLVATRIVEQVEQARQSEMRRLVSQAELRALQSQINPHFLFNALNTLYGIIPREATGARRTVLNLADIFRYFLQSEKTFLPLEEELHIVQAYLEIEHLRLGAKLRTEVQVDEGALEHPIPILSIEPLVENAVKHGIARKAEGGLVRLEVRKTESGLRVAVHDTGGGFAASQSRDSSGAGVGLDNVRRRLRLCYGPQARLEIKSGSAGSTVSFRIPAGHALETVR